MTDNWKSLLPEKYVHLTKCYQVLKHQPCESTAAEIVICTSQGYVLEFSRHRIVGCCKVTSVDAKRITYFITFEFKNNPLYIVESPDDVIILNKEKELQVLKQYKNVKRSLISDFLNTGYPQLRVWRRDGTCNEFPDIRACEKSAYEDDIYNILNEKYEELKIKVKDYEHQLKLKKQHRLHYCEVMGPAMRTPSTSGLELIKLVGQDQGEIPPKAHRHQEEALQTAGTWQRVHNRKWVVGITVCNVGQRNLQNLHLILKSNDEEKLTYVSKVVLYAKDEVSPSCKRAKLDGNLTGLGAWKQIDVLNSRRKATFIGMLDVPKFVNSSVVRLSVLITYAFEGETNIGHQVPVSSFQYPVEHYSKGIGTPFSSETSEADLLSVLMSSVTITVPVVYKANFEPSLPKILVEELKFVEYTQLGCLYHKGTCHTELAGILLHVDKVDPLNYHLSISARDIQHIYLLVHCMYNVLSAPLVLVFPPQLPSSKETQRLNHQFIDEEMELVVNQLRRWVVKKDKSVALKADIQVPYEEYLKFRAQLLELEHRTDISHQ